MTDIPVRQHVDRNAINIHASLQNLETAAANTNRLLASIQQQLSSLFTATQNLSVPVNYISAASTNATSVVASACVLTHLSLGNTTGTENYLKLYNKASAPTVGTDTPVRTIVIPANTATAERLVQFEPFSLHFTSGLAFAVTAGVAHSDTANAVAGITINIGYRIL